MSYYNNPNSPRKVAPGSKMPMVAVNPAIQTAQQRVGAKNPVEAADIIGQSPNAPVGGGSIQYEGKQANPFGEMKNNPLPQTLPSTDMTMSSPRIGQAEPQFNQELGQPPIIGQAEPQFNQQMGQHPTIQPPLMPPMGVRMGTGSQEQQVKPISQYSDPRKFDLNQMLSTMPTPFGNSDEGANPPEVNGQEVEPPIGVSIASGITGAANKLYKKAQALGKGIKFGTQLLPEAIGQGAGYIKQSFAGEPVAEYNPPEVDETVDQFQDPMDKWKERQIALQPRVQTQEPVVSAKLHSPENQLANSIKKHDSDSMAAKEPRTTSIEEVGIPLKNTLPARPKMVPEGDNGTLIPKFDSEYVNKNYGAKTGGLADRTKNEERFARNERDRNNQRRASSKVVADINRGIQAGQELRDMKAGKRPAHLQPNLAGQQKQLNRESSERIARNRNISREKIARFKNKDDSSSMANQIAKQDARDTYAANFDIPGYKTPVEVGQWVYDKAAEPGEVRSLKELKALAQQVMQNMGEPGTDFSKNVPGLISQLNSGFRG